MPSNYAFVSSWQKIISCRNWPWKFTMSQISLCASKAFLHPWGLNNNKINNKKPFPECRPHTETGRGVWPWAETRPCGFGMRGIAGRGRHQMTRLKVEITPVTGQGREGTQNNGGGGEFEGARRLSWEREIWAGVWGSRNLGFRVASMTCAKVLRWQSRSEQARKAVAREWKARHMGWTEAGMAIRAWSLAGPVPCRTN